jgi:hypothetical protein
MSTFQASFSAQNAALASKVSRYATERLALPTGTWLCVGSRASDTNTTTSDIDLLFFSAQLADFRRLDELFEGTRISVCASPLQYIRDDMYKGEFGGYFAAKLLNPHVIVNPDGRVAVDITKAPFMYFYPFIDFMARGQALRLDNEAMLALSIITLINICPGYDAYFLQLFTHPTFAAIWQCWQTQFHQSCVASGAEVVDGDRKSVVLLICYNYICDHTSCYFQTRPSPLY